MVQLELQAADDDPVRFAQRLLGGLDVIAPGFADLVALVPLQGAGLGDPMLEALEMQLAELDPDRQVAIVLDDLHHVSNSAILLDLGRLVGLLPPQVHLILSSRSDPPLAWSRRRLQRDLIEIRQSDLALDQEDTSVLLEHITGQQLPPDLVTSLVERTEGWAAGLQLAGMTLRLQEDPVGFVAQFSGDDRMVADYLSEEVLQAQPPFRRTLLLQLSVLDRISAELVTTLTGESAAQLLLEELEHQSMFLIPLDSRRAWYRFHHLFRDLLRYRLRAEDPLAEARLLDRAAAWELDRGNTGAAVEYLLRAGTWDRAVDVIMASGSELYERGELATVIRWIDAVPESVRTERQDVNLFLGALKVAEGQAAAAEDALRRVAASAAATTGERICATSFLAVLAPWRSRPENSIEIAERALTLLDEHSDAEFPVFLSLTDPRSLETMVTLSGGRAHFLAGHTGAARDWMQRGLTTQGAAYSVWRVHGLGARALLEAWYGETVRSVGYVEEALSIADEVGLLVHPATTEAYLAAALVALERGEPTGAALPLHEGRVRADSNRRLQMRWIGMLLDAMLHRAEGRYGEALTTIDTATRELGTPHAGAIAGRELALRCGLLRRTGEGRRGLRLLEREASPSAAVQFEYAATALELGDLPLARKVMDGREWEVEGAEPLAIIEWSILQAWTAELRGEPGWRSHLVDALDAAEHHRLVEVFIRAGGPVLQLVARLEDEASAFRSVVLNRARQMVSPSPGSQLADPLTTRELDILTHLPSRATNTELAAQFYVSVNTVKSHMAHIYRKLGVASRNEAIARSRELGLL